MSSLADEKEAALGQDGSSSAEAQAERSQWGKERQINEIDEMDRSIAESNGEPVESDTAWQEDVKKGKERCMHFASFDLKRSWRAGAVGEEITRDSRDKSWVRRNKRD